MRQCPAGQQRTVLYRRPFLSFSLSLFVVALFLFLSYGISPPIFERERCGPERDAYASVYVSIYTPVECCEIDYRQQPKKVLIISTNIHAREVDDTHIR